jgi:hypothetical protein
MWLMQCGNTLSGHLLALKDDSKIRKLLFNIMRLLKDPEKGWPVMCASTYIGSAL